MTTSDTLSARLRQIAQALGEAREHAFGVPFGGSYWPCLSLADADTLLIGLRACETRIAQFEALLDTFDTALPGERIGRTARRATLRVISKEDQP